MLDHVAPDVSSAKNSGSSWKIVTKGKRSKKSVAKNVNGITKLVGRSPKQVGDFMVSNYDKFDKSITGKLVSNEAQHIPPKKRHPLQSPSQPQSSAQYKDESLFPQPLTPSPHGDSKLQLKGFRGSSTLNFRDCVDGVNDSAAFTDVVDQKLYNPDDFSGIELLAAAACIDGMDDDAGNINVREHSMPTIPATSEPIKCSVSMEQLSSLSSDMVNENTDTKCSSLDNYGVLPQILQENEDVAMKELEASKVDRRYWDLNVMMDDWQEPLDYSVEEAPSVNVSGPNMEVEKLEEEGCKISMKSGNDNSTANPRHVNQTEQIKSELVCGSDKVSRGLAIFKESPTKPINDQTSDSDKENKVGYIVSSNSGSPAVEMHQLSHTYVDEVPAHLCSEDISIVCETAKDINQIMSSNNVNTCMDNIGPAGLDRSQCGSNIDSVVVALPGETSKLPDNSGSNSSPGRPNRNDLSASSSSSRSVTCTVKGQLDSIYVSDITVCGSPADCVLKEPTSFVDENCLPKAGEEVRATLPVAIQKDVDSLNDIPTSGSAEIGPSLGDCHYSDVSQDDRRNTIGSEDMNGFQDGNDSSYEDGELRIFMPCPWEENEMDDGNSECVDYESDDRGVGSDGADYPGLGVVEASSECSLGGEKRNLSVRKASFSIVNQSRSLTSTTNIRCMKEETKKTDIGRIKSTTRPFTKMGQFNCNDNLRRRHSSGHLDGIETTGSYLEEINPSNKRKLQSYGEDSESLGAAGYLQQSNRSCSYSRPIRNFSPDKFMGRNKSTCHVRERNGGHDRWREYWGSRDRLGAGRQGDGHGYDRPRNMTADTSNKLSGFNYLDHKQAPYVSKAPTRVQNSRSKYETDDYYNDYRRAPGVTNRSRGSSGSFPQGVNRSFRNEYYNPSHDNYASSSSRKPRYLSGREPSFSPSGRLTQNSIPRMRSRSRSRTRSPHPLLGQRERNQVGGRRYTRSPDFRPGARMRMPFEKPSFPADYPRSFVSPPKGRFSPQHNRRWVNDQNQVENSRNGRSPVRMSERAYRFDSSSSAGRFKEDGYSGPRTRPGRFPPPSSTRRRCNFDGYYDDTRHDGRTDAKYRSRHSDVNATANRFRHGPESFDCQDHDDSWNTEARDVPLSSRNTKV